jgi:hypothetical protein
MSKKIEIIRRENGIFRHVLVTGELLLNAYIELLPDDTIRVNANNYSEVMQPNEIYVKDEINDSLSVCYETTSLLSARLKRLGYNDWDISNNSGENSTLGSLIDRELVVTTYECKIAFVGASIGDTITCTQIIDVTGAPTNVSTIWRNQTTAANLASVPSAANLSLLGSQALTNAQLRAAELFITANSLPLPEGASTEEKQDLLIQSLTEIDAKLPEKVNNRTPVTPENITTKFREAFEAYTPGVKWAQNKESGDLIYVDGNAVGASYLVISKDPLVAGTVSAIESISRFNMPFEANFGIALSQRTLGQEFSVEFVDDTLINETADIAIGSIAQSGTTLTIDTTIPHGLSVGKCIGIKDCSNPIANYPALVVATIPSPTQFTVTAGPAGNIPSQTITNPAGSKGFVYVRERLGRASNGISLIYESALNTNASVYLRSEAGDALPSGTPSGNHSATIGQTNPVQAVTAPYTYAFAPSNEYRMSVATDKVQILDSNVDVITGYTSRYQRTQVCPNNEKQYKLRLRATNNKSLTVPVAQIVSITKSGTNIATVITDVPHGLIASDPIVLYGVRDQTSFPNLTTANSVASIISPNSFTVIIGSAQSVISYGGFVAKVQGGNLGSALGYNSIVAQSAVLSTLSDGTRQLVLVGNNTWGGLSFGDNINLLGCRNIIDGSTLGIDGVWKVANMASTTLTLVLPFSDSMSLPSDFASTNCGGGIIKRTELRVSFIRIFDYKRERVEFTQRPLTDIASALAVYIAGAQTLNIAGTVGVSSIPATPAGANYVGQFGDPIPTVVADIASGAITTTATTAAITPAFGSSYEVNIPVTAVSGTNPTLDISIEESDDNGTNWFKVYDFPRITATGMYRSPKLLLTGNRIRYVQTLTGTSPSFTRSLNRLQCSDIISPIRQLIDRTVVLTTLNSVTPSINVQNCDNVQININVGAIATTAPALQLEGSDDNGLSWTAIGTPQVAVGSSTITLRIVDVNVQLVRARVSTAGVGVTAGYILIKGY